MEDQEFRQKERTYRIIIGILIVIILFLGWQWLANKSKVRTVVIQSEQANQQKDFMKAELDSLLAVHDKIKGEYGNISKSLKAKDSLIQANASEIRDLLNYKYDYNKIKRKLDLLRNITQNYVRQIDSLLTVNTSLRKENVEIKDYLSQEKEKNVVLSKEKNNLTEQVNKAAFLKAYNVVAEGVHIRSAKKQEPTNKARKTDQVKVCFTLSENPVAQPGPRMIYIRIARPDNVIITEGTEASSFLFNGERIQYTMRKEVEYQGKSQQICVSWNKHDKKSDAMTGVYSVSVFCDDYEIGQSSFELK
jgi:hypothetical protein